MSVVRITALLSLALAAAATGSVAAQTESVAARPEVPAPPGSVSGVVYDSIDGGPLGGATVYLWNTAHRAPTDAEGRFRIEGVEPGDYTVLFFHDHLAQLGVSAGPRTVTVPSGGDVAVELSTPSMATVVRTQCLIEDRPEGAGALAGRVIDGRSGLPLGGARVTLSWNEEASPQAVAIVVETGPYGWYRSCQVPGSAAVLLATSYLGMEGVRREARVASDAYEEAWLEVFESSPSSITGRLVDAESGDGIEGAETWLRGTSQRVLTDGRGHFSLGSVAPGTYMLMTDHLAYGTKMDTLVVPSAQRLMVEMRLDTRPIEVAPLTVTAEAPPVTIDRRRGGIVITRQEIDEVRQRSRDASDVLRSLHVPGVIVRTGSNGRTCVGFITGQVKMTQTGCVEMQVYINDVRATDPSIALRLSPDAIERMVVYKPLEAGNLFGLGGGNGVWMIYTRGN